MFYLKCNNCGHFNEIKTEYMVLCEKCNKKLENSFSQWSKHNPDKSFEDYKDLVCSEEKIDDSESLSQSKKNKGVKYWICFAVTFVICYVLASFAVNKLFEVSHGDLLDEKLTIVASEINKQCPMMIDNETRLDNTVAMPDNVFQYNYTLVSADKESFDIESVKNYLEPTIVNIVKTNPDMQTMRDNKVTVRYCYKDKSGMHLFTISVSPEQYE